MRTRLILAYPGEFQYQDEIKIQTDPALLGFLQLKSSVPGERAKTGSPGRGARKAGVNVTEETERERPEKGWDESVADCLLCGK